MFSEGDHEQLTSYMPDIEVLPDVFAVFVASPIPNEQLREWWEERFLIS